MHTTVYELIPRDRLRDMITAFNACIGLPIQLLDETGNLLESYGQVAGYCSKLRKHAFDPNVCMNAHLYAGKQALVLGEPYIFACSANLNHIAFPLESKGLFLGTVIVGPFLMDTPDSTLISDVSEKYALPTTVLLELYDELLNIKIVPPSQVSQISRLLYYLFSPLLPGERLSWESRHEKLSQQSRISETIQQFKTHGVQELNDYPYQKEKELLAQVRAGNAKEAKGLLNELLGQVLFSEGGRLDKIKNHAIALCTLLSRVALDSGAVSDSIFRLNNAFLNELQHIDTLEDLCYQLQEITETFVSVIFKSGPQTDSETVNKAVRYISRHYAEPLTLEILAQHVNLSPPYLSVLFHRRTGSSVREYINQVRIEESKRLLASTDYSLVDIAIAMGFTDQSYFTKVFKKYTGLTPKQFR